MRYTITPAAMRQLELDYMTDSGVPGALLMEHAAQGVVQAIQRYIAPGGCVLFLCGPGNNGGDGYAAARLWQASGGISLIGELSSQARGDALVNRRLAEQVGIPFFDCSEGIPAMLHHPIDAIVDALFGTGLARQIEGPAANLIHWMNTQHVPIIAVDIPSGLDGLDGTIRAAEPVYATETVTFHRIKQGLVLRDGPNYTGNLTVHPILIPKDYGSCHGLCALEEDDLQQFLPPRAAACHKGDFGRIVIFAGSPGMIGAATFCASACVRTGAGLTTILCRESLLPMLQTLAPEAMCVALPEENGQLRPGADATAARLLQHADAAIIGCGLGQSADLLPLLQAFRNADCSVVWDADALNLLAAHRELLPLPKHHVITPHPGEAARLLATTTNAIVHDPLTSLAALQQCCGCTVLLKGARTLLCDGLRTYVNLYGSPALAKGGSGDVLAGMIGALLGRKGAFSPLEASALGAMLHGLAGQRAAQTAGEHCSTPQLLIQHIHLDAHSL